MGKIIYLTSPLDQFEIRNFLVLELPIFNYIQLSLTNIAFYLIISLSIGLILTRLSNNNNKIVPNSWSISQEAIYATIYNIVINQIGANKGQIYFPFIYSLFIFILINNLMGMVQIGCLYNLLCVMSLQPKVLSKFKSVRFYSSNNNTNIIPPYFLTGFTDGEGCFSFSISPSNKKTVSWTILPVFKLIAHYRDKPLLEAIKTSLGGR